MREAMLKETNHRQWAYALNKVEKLGGDFPGRNRQYGRIVCWQPPAMGVKGDNKFAFATLGCSRC
jgi:hypothetical protein